MSKLKQTYSVERGFISKVLETGNMKLLKDLQIKEVFLTGDNRRVFHYIMEHFKTTGEVPTPRILLQKFPSYKLETHTENDVVGTDESLVYWCEEVRTKAKHNRLADITEDVASKLDKGETEEAYSVMKQGVWQIEGEIVYSESVDITKNTEDRKAAYLERKKNKGMMGIPMGIPHLDYLLKGLIKETLTTLIATTGIGKTWFLVLIGAYAQLNGYKVCIFITEMSTDIMQDRFDAMLFGMMYEGFDYNDFKSGSLTTEKENQYFEFLEDDLPRLESLVIETATGISSIVSVIEREKPDLVLVDGAYLMEDEQGAKDDWLRVTHITRDLKKTAKNWHVPIFINTQADQNTSKKSGPGLGDIKYAQSIGMDSDNILAMYRDEIMYNDNEMGVRVLKQREGATGKVVLNWDFHTMNFNSIYSEESKGVEDNESEDVQGVIGMND